MTYYLKQEDVKEYFEIQTESLKEQGYTDIQVSGILSLHYTQKVIIKYTKEEQDKMLNDWIHLILEVKGGYWQVQELIQQPHSEFTHYRTRGLRSYEKGNVSKNMAERELSPSAYIAYCEKLDKAKIYKQIGVL